MTYGSTKSRRAFWAWGLFLGLLAVAGLVSADDRDLLRDASGEPYMGVILDTSGSMHWTPPCNEIDACLDIDPWDGMCTTECPLGLDLCKQICPDLGCVEYDFSLVDEPETYTILMDTEDGAGIELEGAWSSSQTFSPFEGNDYLHNGNTGQGDKSVTFRPIIPADGIYQIYLFWNANEFRATNVPVTIVHADGEDTILVNQGEPSLIADHTIGVFDYNYIATYEFEAGTTGSITIGTDGTNHFVVADALRMFGVAKPDAGVACLRTGYRCQQPLCPDGDCQAPLNGDDPTSKFFLAKSALYEVLGEATTVHLGFATYEQDNARLKAKHWLYEVMETKPGGAAQDLEFPIFGYTFPETVDEFPAVGSQYVFGNGAPYDDDGLGDGWNCAHYDSPSDPNTNTVDYPGKEDAMGTLIDSRGDAAVVSCFFSEPADLNDDWEMERARRLPKLGLDGTVPTTVWYRDSDSPGFLGTQPDGRMIKVVYNPVAGSSYGNNVIAVDIEAFRCLNATCSGAGGFSLGTNTVYFKLVSDFVSWEDKIGRQVDEGLGYFHDLRNVEVNTNMDCNGLELNDDTCHQDECTAGIPGTEPLLDLEMDEDDYWYEFTFKRPTEVDARGDAITITNAEGDDVRADWFDEGDFLPMDWNEKHTVQVLRRLAPNMVVAGGSPDFRTATYWDNTHIDGDGDDEGDPLSPTNRRLAIADEDQLPLLPIGKTPIAASLDDFRNWFAGDESESLNGWSGIAAERDNNWACRDKFVLFLTDGNETCGGDPCEAARLLFDAGVSTYVVGFGLENSESTLGCIAEKGGTGEPLFPRNKDELVDALREIVSTIKSESRSFASASVPAIQSTAADKIFLSSFIPLTNASIWPGEIDAFRKPLPLDERKRPDTTRKCTDGRESGCHLWEVGEIILLQTPTNQNLLDGDYHVGPGRDERRIFYSQGNPTGKRPSDLVLFRPPYLGASGDDTADLEDLAEKVVDEDIVADFITDRQFILDNPGLTEAEIEALVTSDDLEDEVKRVIVNTLKRKELPEAVVEGDRTHYIMGDIFHSNPAVISGPSDFNYFSNDLCGVLQTNKTPNNCVDGVDRGYRRFAREHIWRRRLLVAATNDGQLHFIDGGTRVEASVAGSTDTTEVFTDGTGEEIFSYIPRLTLPIVREQALNSTHIFSLDGNLVTRDVFIDPEDATGDATPAEREWRTVLMAGMREAGDRYEDADEVEDFVSGYFALDITQPDILVQRETDKDSLGNFNDPPLESLVPVDSALAGGTNAFPSCLNFDYSSDGHQSEVTAGGTYDCGGKFPSELWTFTDTIENGLYVLDEDGDAARDLGDTWSTPVIGQMAVCGVEGGDCIPGGDDLTSVHVAVFGGGMDPDNKVTPQKGNWLYILNMETGNAIYKRHLEGAAPSDPAVLDVNKDGLIDTIYIGTTAGLLYKVDLTALDGSEVPHLKEVDLRGKTIPSTDPTDASDQAAAVRIIDGGAWDPFPIVRTHDDAPIYFPPSAFFIPELNRYGLIFGTGDREDLWVPTTKEGRMYVLVDEGFTSADITADPLDLAADTTSCDLRLPVVDECLENLGWNDDPPLVDGTEIVDNSVNYLLEPQGTETPSDPSDDLRRGYVITFPETFRLTAQPFVLTGITVFPVFEPIAFIPDLADGSKPVCARTGITRSFVVLAQNANPIARLSSVDQGEDPEIDGDIVVGGDVDTSPPGATDGAYKSQDRYHRIAEFTTAPFIDNVATKNDPNTDGQTVGDLVEEQVEAGVREAIMSYYPRGSRFNDAYRVAITAMRVTTGVNVYATIPQAIYPADWKEKQ